ncbi:nucleotidyltransferase family protein [Paenibacillus thiaminolyticus]|uniref:nucleotidyltransferase family protein n=1 Tax=Paenibacillus thiaminolyticus TaxID=49283 RepID=UPI0035A72037
MLEQRLLHYLHEHEELMADLRSVRDLQLPQCYISAGYIRNYIWDRLHGFEYRARHQDIDVVYYDLEDLSEQRDVALEQELIRRTGNEKWSVKNQARMHVRNGVAPYASTHDALSRWPETATAVGARLNGEERIELIHPHGLEDLFQMVVRRSPEFPDPAYYMARVNAKQWREQWPLLTIIEA